VKWTGATVHFVDAGVDTGPVILQAVVPVMDDDTEETLSAQLIAGGGLRVDGRQITSSGGDGT